MDASRLLVFVVGLLAIGKAAGLCEQYPKKSEEYKTCVKAGGRDPRSPQQTGATGSSGTFNPSGLVTNPSGGGGDSGSPVTPAGGLVSDSGSSSSSLTGSRSGGLSSGERPAPPFQDGPASSAGPSSDPRRAVPKCCLSRALSVLDASVYSVRCIYRAPRWSCQGRAAGDYPS